VATHGSGSVFSATTPNFVAWGPAERRQQRKMCAPEARWRRARRRRGAAASRARVTCPRKKGNFKFITFNQKDDFYLVGTFVPDEKCNCPQNCPRGQKVGTFGDFWGQNGKYWHITLDLSPNVPGFIKTYFGHTGTIPRGYLGNTLEISD
jgi:hypothetical protein